jgi:hypothetical protein
MGIFDGNFVDGIYYKSDTAAENARIRKRNREKREGELESNRGYREALVEDHLDRREAMQAASHQHRSRELELLQQRTELEQRAKTEREQLRLEAAKITAATELEKIERQAAERERSVAKFQELERSAVALTEEYRAQADRYAHPSLPKYLSAPFSFDLATAVLQILGPPPLKPLEPKLGIVADVSLRSLLPSLVPGRPMPRNDAAFRAEVEKGPLTWTYRNHTTKEAALKWVRSYSLGYRLGYYLIPGFAERMATKKMNENNAIWERQRNEHVEEKYNGRLATYRIYAKNDAHRNAEVIDGFARGIGRLVAELEQRVGAAVSDYDRRVPEHAQSLIDHSLESVEYQTAKNDIEQLYGELFTNYSGGDRETVESFLRASTAHSLLGYDSDGAMVKCSWNAKNHAAVVDFVLPRLDSPTLRGVSVSAGAEMVVSDSFSETEQRELTEVAKRELPIRVALELLRNDLPGQIRSLTVNAWRRGLLVGGSMRGISCYSTFTIKPEEARDYDGNAAGLLRAVGGSYSGDEDTDVNPAHSNIKDGTIECGTEAPHSGNFLRALAE